MAVLLSNVIIDPNSGLELVKHGNISFPIACYDHDFMDVPAPWHWHEELEAAVVSEGMIACSIGSQHFELKAGEGYFVNAGVLHKQETVSSHPPALMHCVVFHSGLIGGEKNSVFTKKYIEPLISSQSFSGCALKPDVPWQSEMLDYIGKTWNSCRDEGAQYELEVRDSLSRLVSGILNHIPADSVSRDIHLKRDADRIKGMLLFIQENYMQKIDLSDIAAVGMLGKRECLRCFQKTIRISPIRYLLSYRLKKSAELLRLTDWTVTEIAERCGFQDSSYFSRAFRKAFSVTPLEYRNLADPALQQNKAQKKEPAD